MTMSATMVLSSPFAQIVPQQPIEGIINVYNSSGSAVTVSSVNLWATQQGSPIAFGQPFYPGNSTTVPAAGSLAIGFGVTFFGPQVANATQEPEQYTLNATVFTSDGSVFQPNSLVVQVFQSTAAAPAGAGQFLQASPLNAVNYIEFLA